MFIFASFLDYRYSDFALCDFILFVLYWCLLVLFFFCSCLQSNFGRSCVKIDASEVICYALRADQVTCYFTGIFVHFFCTSYKLYLGTRKICVNFLHNMRSFKINIHFKEQETTTILLVTFIVVKDTNRRIYSLWQRPSLFLNSTPVSLNRTMFLLHFLTWCLLFVIGFQWWMRPVLWGSTIWFLENEATAFWGHRLCTGYFRNVEWELVVADDGYQPWSICWNEVCLDGF